MQKYKVIIELDENRDTCLDCPFCQSDDACALQITESADSWATQLSQCPLEAV